MKVEFFVSWILFDDSETDRRRVNRVLVPIPCGHVLTEL